MFAFCSGFAAMPWPSNIPHDLALALAELDGRRVSAGDADRWAVFKEWLERHNVAAPEALPVRPEMRHPGW